MNIATLVRIKHLSVFVVVIHLSGCLASEGEPAVPETPAPPSGNSTPTISGIAPLAITIGTAYSFTPAANDPDGDTLTFSIQNQPEWASFDRSTGRLSGTPTLGHVGVYQQVRISVSDGQASASLPDFGIDVTSVALGSLTVSWEPPTTNEDGTTLTDLAGYRLYYGTSADDLSNVIPIDNPSITAYVVENLSPNTYFFSATSFNSQGIESVFSSTASGVVN